MNWIALAAVVLCVGCAEPLTRAEIESASRSCDRIKPEALEVDEALRLFCENIWDLHER